MLNWAHNIHTHTFADKITQTLKLNEFNAAEQCTWFNANFTHTTKKQRLNFCVAEIYEIYESRGRVRQISAELTNDHGAVKHSWCEKMCMHWEKKVWERVALQTYKVNVEIFIENFKVKANNI